MCHYIVGALLREDNFVGLSQLSTIVNFGIQDIRKVFADLFGLVYINRFVTGGFVKKQNQQ